MSNYLKSGHVLNLLPEVVDRRLNRQLVPHADRRHVKIKILGKFDVQVDIVHGFWFEILKELLFLPFLCLFAQRFLLQRLRVRLGLAPGHATLRVLRKEARSVLVARGRRVLCGVTD